MPLAARDNLLRQNITDLEGRQRNGWQRCCVVIECFGSGDSTLKLDMRAETVRCEFNIAVLDIIYDTLRKVQYALACIGTRVIDSSYGQRASDKINIAMNGAIFAFNIEAERSNKPSESRIGQKLSDCYLHFWAAGGELSYSSVRR